MNTTNIITVFMAIIASCFIGCKKPCHHEARLDRLDKHTSHAVDISEWVEDGKRVVIGVCALCGTITHATTTYGNAMEVVPVSNGVPLVSFGSPTKSARAAMDKAQDDLINRMETSTNAVLVMNCEIEMTKLPLIISSNENRFVLVTGCRITND